MATTATVDRTTQKQVIIYTGKDLGYLDARELVRDKGGLPSNVLHDDVLVRSEDWKQLRAQNYYGAWAREILVHPEANVKFEKGKDVVDASKDGKGREWKFDGALIPLEAFEVEKPSLFVNPGNDPKNIDVNDKRVVIAGFESIAVISPSIQVSGQVGRVDEATRIPLYVDETLRDQLTDDQKRWLWRIEGAGVRPLVRVFSDGFVNGRYVLAGRGHGDGLGVGWVSLSQAEPEQVSHMQAVVQVPSDFISALHRDAEDAESILEKLKPIMRTGDFDKLKRVISGAKTLDIKE